jgi:hypothetical protein
MPKIEGYEIAYINAEGRPKVFITTETLDGSARAYFAAKHRNTEILSCRPLARTSYGSETSDRASRGNFRGLAAIHAFGRPLGSLPSERQYW